MLKKLIIKSIVLSIISKGFALNLVDAYHHAISFNAEYLQMKELTQGKYEESIVAKSALLPQISMTGSISQNYIDQPQFNAWYYQPTYGIQMQQVLLDFAKISAYSKQKYLTAMSELQLDKARQQLLIKVVGSYLDVLYAEDVLKSTQSAKNALNLQYQSAVKAFQLGTATRTDMADAKAALDNITSEEIIATTTLISRKNTFYKITGCNAIDLSTLDRNGLFEFESNPSMIKSLLDDAKGRNPDINIANKQVEVALEEIKIAQSGHLPSLNLKLAYQYQDSAGIVATNASSQQLQQATTTPGSPLSSYGVGNIGVQLNIPLYSGGRVSAQVRQAQDYYSASKYQQIQVWRETEQQVQDNYWQLHNGINLIHSQTEALNSAQLKLKSDTKSYQIGLRNSIDLVNAEMTVYHATQNLYKAYYEFLQAKVRLTFLTGNLNDNYIQQINGYFSRTGKTASLSS